MGLYSISLFYSGSVPSGWAKGKEKSASSIFVGVWSLCGRCMTRSCSKVRSGSCKLYTVSLRLTCNLLTWSLVKVRLLLNSHFGTDDPGKTPTRNSFSLYGKPISETTISIFNQTFPLLVVLHGKCIEEIEPSHPDSTNSLIV
jgi:hypothetical protein